jgi:hypothetical protein
MGIPVLLSYALLDPLVGWRYFALRGEIYKLPLAPGCRFNWPNALLQSLIAILAVIQVI